MPGSPPVPSSTSRTASSIGCLLKISRRYQSARYPKVLFTFGNWSQVTVLLLPNAANAPSAIDQVVHHDLLIGEVYQWHCPFRDGHVSKTKKLLSELKRGCVVFDAGTLKFN